MNEQPLQERYNDFTVEGIAEPTFGQTSEWVALAAAYSSIRTIQSSKCAALGFNL